MSFLGKRLILSVFIVGTIVLGVFVTIDSVRGHTIFCKYDDPVLCTYLANVQKGKITKLEGTYQELHTQIPVFQVDWKLSGNDQEMLYRDSLEEQMHVVMVDGKVYLKDYGDGRWWEQSLSMLEQYETHLPFEPKVFITNLQANFEDSRNHIYFVQQDICGVDTCRKYALSLKDTSDKKIIFYLSEKTQTLQKIHIEKGNLTQEIAMNVLIHPISKPQRDIKLAKKDENIFLINFLERSQTNKSTPDYVRQFEQLRIESEQDRELQSGGPIYIDPQSTEDKTIPFMQN